MPPKVRENHVRRATSEFLKVYCSGLRSNLLNHILRHAHCHQTASEGQNLLLEFSEAVSGILSAPSPHPLTPIKLTNHNPHFLDGVNRGFNERVICQTNFSSCIFHGITELCE